VSAHSACVSSYPIVLCSWKFACLHLDIQVYDQDPEDCTVTPDFHDVGLPLKNIHSVEGSAQAHIRSLYPSWTGNIAEIIQAYFLKIGVEDQCSKFDTINNLQGTARRLALEEDVKSRVLDWGERSPQLVGLVSRRGKPEAFDMTVDEEITPLGTVHQHEVYVPVATPIFEKRMLEKAENEKLSKVQKSMVAFDELLESVDEQGFLQISKLTADPKELPKIRRDATVISIASHNRLLQSKEAANAVLRAEISRLKQKKPDAPTAITSSVVDLSDELDEAKTSASLLLDRIQELQKQLTSKQAKLDLAEAEQKAAVANAKVEVMQSMMGGGFSTNQTPNRGYNTN
jgi:hypothetical protein